MATWNFTKLRPDTKTREPIQGEFFTNESIERSGEALIREGIQNALDAGVGDKVHVRIFVSGPSFGVPSDTHQAYFDGAWEHLEAEGNGLKDIPDPNDDCSFIVFEDFGTSGLEGDTSQFQPIKGNRNPFYHFVRAEGRSDKGEHERGRWGVEKFVFPRSSRINTILCASIRSSDSQKLLIGQTVLKTHRVGDEYYTPDGLFGELTENGLTLPITDENSFDRVCRSFNLDRSNEPGLSIVIPWHDPDIDADSLLAATVIGYFYPILAGRLEVTIETPDGETLLNSSSIVDVASELDISDSGELAEFCRLALFACDSDMRFETQLPDQKNSVKWHDEMLSDEQRKEISEKLDSGDMVGVKVPIVVTKKDGEHRDSHFEVFLVRDSSNSSGRPVFVREGIIISDVQSPRSRGIRSLGATQKSLREVRLSCSTKSMRDQIFVRADAHLSPISFPALSMRQGQVLVHTKGCRVVTE